jgi:peptidoglycan/LPS O-acetylase OafA/YrhL
VSPVVVRIGERHPRRADVQGLRAVAVAMVVVYHLWPDALPGGFIGVDVFFVISGYLITASLLASPPRTGRDLAAFWARRIRRLLPAALLVLLVTLLVGRLLLPETEWERLAREGVASAFYVENWVLVHASTDYLAGGGTPSPFQHFWSLAVEEQFYLVWPVLLLVAAWAVRGSRGVRIAVLLVLGASYAWSVVWTAQEPAAAYFSTTTRIWELALGGLVATWVPVTWAPRLRGVVAWVGLLVMGASAAVLTSSTPFPGAVAAVPVVAAAAFLHANAAGRWSPLVALRWRPVQWLGDASYSVYLWHWPLIVLAPSPLDRDLRWFDRMGIVVLALVLAGLTHAFVEERWRRPRRAVPLRRPFQVALAGTMAIVVVAGVQVVALRLDEQRANASRVGLEGTPCFGAGALARGAQECPREPDADVVPSPARAADDQAAPFTDGCMARPPFTSARSCTYGDGDLRVALVGNSHAAHWLPALEQLTGDDEVTVTTFLVTGCTTVDAPLDFATDDRVQGCEQWRESTLAAVSGDAFDVVLTSQRNLQPVRGADLATSFGPWKDGFRSFLARLSASGAEVLVLRDTPFPETTVADIPECVAAHRTRQEVCAAPRDVWLTPDPLAAAAAEVDGVAVADLSDAFCEAGRCHGVNGGVITYTDGSHLTATYARSLAPRVAEALRLVRDR